MTHAAEPEKFWLVALRELGESMTASADRVTAGQGEGVFRTADWLAKRHAAGARDLEVLDPDGDPQLCTRDEPRAFLDNYWGFNQTMRRAVMATWPPGLRASNRLA